MANTIVLKRSSTPNKVPTTSQLALGEVAINTYDGRMFIKKDDGTASIVEIGGVTSVNGQTGTAVLGTDEVTEGSGNLYFTNARARAALSAGTGISYNSSTGVISTAQNLSTTGTPTFAGMTLTGDVGITGDIIPSVDNTYSLGSASYMWRDVYVGPGSLYVNGQKVLEDNSGTITVSADVDQTLQLRTTGSGNVQVTTDPTAVFQVNATMQIASGKNITDSAGVEVNFGDAIDMNSNKILNLGAPSAASDAATKSYVDTAVSSISTNSIEQGNSNVTVSDTGTGTVTVSIDGSTALTVTSTGVVVAGNFTVSGTTTTVNSNTVAVADNILTLNSDTTGSATQNAGIEVERGDDTNVSVRWNEGSDVWQFTNDGATYFPLATSTDVLAEGTSNLYFTAARARNALSASTATGISFNSTTGAFSLGSIPNSSLTNNDITLNGTTVSLGGSGSFDTDAVSEGANNLYFTNARARGAISVTDAGGDGSLSFNSTTGVITYTGPSAAEVRAHFSAGTGINITSGTISTSITQYTDALARAAVSVSGDLSYNSTTGVISFTQDKAFASLTGKPTTVSGYGITDAYTKTEVDSAISTAVAGKDNTDEITEGSTNLYFTTARARAAFSAGTNISIVDGVISANDTSVNWSEIQGKPDPVITLAGDLSGSVTLTDLASGTLTATIVANSVALGTDTTGNYMVNVTAGTGISVSHTQGEGSTATITNTGVTSLNGDTGAKTLAAYHATFQTVTATQETNNASSAVTFTFSELSASVQHSVFLNRVLMRPTEYSVSGTTLTIAAGVGLLEGDEIEIVGSRFTA